VDERRREVRRGKRISETTEINTEIEIQETRRRAGKIIEPHVPIQLSSHNSNIKALKHWSNGALRYWNTN